MLRIELVPPRKLTEALRFIAGGAESPGQTFAEAETQAGNLASFAEANPGTRTWWARDRRCVAAAMIVPHPGGSAFLFHSPLEGPGVDRSALTEVVRRATGAALDGGLHFVQVSMLSGGPLHRRAAEDWGYTFVAELIYMGLDLPASQPPSARPELPLRRYGQFSEEELGEVILATYRQSLDCPVLLGLRTADEIIASHKASGLFRPEGWWIADAAGSSAGCVLVNDRPMEDAVEVVYLGVRPEHRGKGLARSMLLLAAEETARRGLRRVLLAADAGNAPAVRLYERMGFLPTHRRWIFAAIRR